MNPMNKWDYVAKGFSEEESEKIVLKNRESLRNSIYKKHSKKIFSEYFPTENFDEDYMLKTHVNFLQLKVNKWGIYVKEISDYFGFGVEHSIEYFYDKIVFYKNRNVRLLSTINAIIDVFGLDSPRHLFWVEKNKKCTTCSFESFKEKYNDLNLSEEEYDRMFKETYGSNNINRLMRVYGVDENGAKEIVGDRSKKSKETWDKKSPEEIEEINKRKANTLENYISRYGVEEGTIKYADYTSSRQGMGSLIWYEQVYGSELGRKIYQEKRGKHNVYFCVEYWIHRGYSEGESSLIIEDIFKNRPNFSKDFCIDKYGKEKGTQVWKARQDLWQETLNKKSESERDDINRRKGMTLENCINKYGEKEGVDRYNSWKISYKNTTNTSKSSLRFFIPIYKQLRKMSLVERSDVHWGIGKNKEYFIRDPDINIIRFYDFVIPKHNIIIEYNGKCFHAREGDFGWKSPFGETYEQSIEYDKQKKYIANKRGFDVWYVWEEDLIRDNNIQDKIINDLIDVIIDRK